MNAETIGLLLERAARAVYDQRGPAAIHPGQWAVLRFLEEADPSARTVGGVAAHLGVTHAPASRAVGALVRKKLVSVEVGADDRRVRALALTEAGRTLLRNDPLRRLAAAVTSLDATQRKALQHSLERVHQGLIARGEESLLTGAGFSAARSSANR